MSDFEFADNAPPIVDGTFLDDEDYQNAEEWEGSAILPDEGSGTPEGPSFTTSPPVFPTKAEERPDAGEVQGEQLTCHKVVWAINNGPSTIGSIYVTFVCTGCPNKNGH